MDEQEDMYVMADPPPTKSTPIANTETGRSLNRRAVISFSSDK